MRSKVLDSDHHHLHTHPHLPPLRLEIRIFGICRFVLLQDSDSMTQHYGT